jgi:chromosome segregation ATPase
MQQRINELQKDNDSLNRALAEAQKDGGSTVSRIRELQAELAQYKNSSGDLNALRTENQAMHDEIAQLKTQQPKGFISMGGGQSSDEVSRERDAFMRQATKLQYENDALKVQLEKTKVVEKELQSTRSYFAPMVEDLQNKNTKLTEEVEQLNAQIQKTQSDAQSATGTLESVAQENKQLKADIQAFKKAEEENDKQMELIRSQLQLTSADKDKLKNQDEEMAKLVSEKKNLEKAYEELQANFKSQDAQFQQVSQQMSAMQKASEEWKGKESQFSGDLSSMQQELETLRAERVKHLRSLERYQTVLRANFTDMQNLKSNFEAYLESLVASFEDRQK